VPHSFAFSAKGREKRNEKILKDAVLTVCGKTLGVGVFEKHDFGGCGKTPGVGVLKGHGFSGCGKTHLFFA
jgi:hypothetical protein